MTASCTVDFQFFFLSAFCQIKALSSEMSTEANHKSSARPIVAVDKTCVTSY